ncbi:glutamine amidotransferase-related protein [Corynebacterium bovis]|uniref:glutamine amidotransferase-related protein n=1 Tax=Corynebacterium bovis TaxID=36808 RepID=UPI003CC743E5
MRSRSLGLWWTTRMYAIGGPFLSCRSCLSRVSRGGPASRAGVRCGGRRGRALPVPPYARRRADGVRDGARGGAGRGARRCAVRGARRRAPGPPRRRPMHATAAPTGSCTVCPMDSSLIVLRHVAFEDLGTWGAVAERAGFRTEYRDVGSDVFRLDDATASADDLTELMEADLVVVLGAPLGLDDTGSYPYLDSEVELIRRRLAARRPVLGVCLGAQLMARALGGTVSTPDRPR